MSRRKLPKDPALRVQCQDCRRAFDNRRTDEISRVEGGWLCQTCAASRIREADAATRASYERAMQTQYELEAERYFASRDPARERLEAIMIELEALEAEAEDEERYGASS